MGTAPATTLAKPATAFEPQLSLSYVLSTQCLDQPGITSALTTAIFAGGGSITEAQQHDDRATRRFVSRIAFDLEGPEDKLLAGIADAAKRFDMTWKLRAPGHRPRVVIMVSRFAHCMGELLYRIKAGDLDMDVVAIISNYPKSIYYDMPGFDEIPYYHLPITPETKPEQEAQVRAVIDAVDAELVILARYMQILSNDLAGYLSGRCINIHHSFLPSFKGAYPYRQAYDRGVKLIGATAHYVTADLDEGPIIEQAVERISHRDTPDELTRKGREIERMVLARAVRYHLADRVFLDGHRTVVFPE